MPSFRIRSSKSSLAVSFLVAGLLLSGCAVGPDFQPPAAPNVKTYSPHGLPDKTMETRGLGGTAQQFVAGADIPSEWWTLFHSQPLNDLIAKAIANNPDLQAAKAALRAAEENLYASEGAFFPGIDGGINIARDKISSASSGGSGRIPAFTLYNSSIQVSYPLDIFGGIRRQVEETDALKDIQRYELEAAYIALTSNIVTAAIQEASLRAQVNATKEIIADEEKQLSLLKKQFELGAVAKAAVLAQEANLAQQRATLPTLEKQLSQTRHQLTALAGQFPSEDLNTTFDLSDLRLPETLPLSLPSQLIQQRPDIQAATAQLHAASAAIGVATANMLPQITLTGSTGVSATQLASLFSPGTAVWNIGAGLLQPLFHGGTLLHQKRASEAIFDQAAAKYRSTVLAAFQNVADALHALEFDAYALKAQVAAERAAADSLKLARDQFNAGAISYLSLLTSEQTLEQAKISLVQAQARRFADTAALFVALGGGWWNRDSNITAQSPETIKTTSSEPQNPTPQPSKKRNFGR